MRTSYQSTTSRPSPSGPNATRGRRAGRSTAAATTRGSSSPGPGSRARRAETPRRDLPDGCHRALPQARDLCRGGYRRDVPGGRLNQEDRGRLRAPLGAPVSTARTVRDGFAETLAYTEFPPEHWRRIRTNNGIERIDCEIRRRTRAVGTYPDGNSVVILVSARLKYIVEHEWSKRRYLDMSKLEEMDELKGKAEG